MATNQIKKQEAIQQEKVAETVSKTEQFFNENKKTLWGVVIAVAVVGLAVLGYSKFIYQPKAAEASEQMYAAEQSFRAGEYELALAGDGNVLGFADVIKEYGAKAGKAVYFYAGVCELQAGNWEEAIKYLKKYNGKDAILAARAKACIGDAYVGLESYSEAVSCFEKAAACADNMFAAGYLQKAGVAYEALGQNDKALACYKKIKEYYPQSIEAYEIDKYISKLEIK